MGEAGGGHYYPDSAEDEALTARDLTAERCPVCGAVPVQPCDRTVLGEWFAFPLPAPWSWWYGPVSVHVHAARLPGSVEKGGEDGA